jgi:hypothetical protein
MHELIDAIGTPLTVFQAYNIPAYHKVDDRRIFDDYHGEIASQLFADKMVLQHAVYMYMITGNAEDGSLKC